MANSLLLILKLEGPLQSWGEHSKWDWRDTALMPTKSGIIGILGCALGYERNDIRLSELGEQLTIAVRADRPGSLITDFHSVQSQRLLNAEGKPRSGGNTMITHRSYLQDACFTVVIAAEERLLRKLASALLHPQWTAYLGRKCCVPSRPILECLTNEYMSLEDAARRYPLTIRKDSSNSEVLIELESADSTGYWRFDVPARENRNFLRRRVVKLVEKPKEVQHVSE